MNWSARRINAVSVINKASRYLEIGVNRGETFFDVNVEFKDGVDPAFQFDTMAVINDKIRLFSETSDNFWISKSPSKYDIIMLDGLHTFEQTFRDLICSMRFAHERTVWLIDDTLPSDVFSAIPDQKRSYRERQKMNIGGFPWHGDVFKIVPAICFFLPVLEYVTIINSGNPQTVAWYYPRPVFQPSANNLESISRMSFFDIEPNFSLFNFAEEADALDRLASAFI